MQMEKPSILEALEWTLFSLGGIVTALLIPIHILVTAILSPLGIVESFNHAAIVARLGTPAFKLYLLILLLSAIPHTLHRIRFILYDIGFGKNRKAVNTLILLVYVATMSFVLYPFLTFR